MCMSIMLHYFLYRVVEVVVMTEIVSVNHLIHRIHPAFVYSYIGFFYEKYIVHKKELGWSLRISVSTYYT